VLDQLDHNGIEAFLAPVSQVLFGFRVGQPHDQRPRGIALHQKRTTILVNKKSFVGAEGESRHHVA
jgi:hypothetical protein